jgi:FdhD protein
MGFLDRTPAQEEQAAAAGPRYYGSMESVTRVPVERWSAGSVLRRSEDDVLAVEQPLEIRIAWTDAGTPREKVVAVTMRTPGNDAELAVGFLFSEGIVRRREDVAGTTVQQGVEGGAVRVEMAPGVAVDLGSMERHSFVSSSCGVCGKTSLAALRTPPADAKPSWTGRPLSAHVVHGLPATLRRAQAAFEETGGIHAAALFDPSGHLEDLREDVGRHNAVDKLLGAALLGGRTPLADRVLLLSGRASFELLQKAGVAGVPVVAAIGAPSSLAVEVAREAGIALVGFLRDDRFNVYAGTERIGEAGLG